MNQFVRCDLSNSTGLKSAIGYSVLVFSLWTVYVAVLYPTVSGISNTSVRLLINDSTRFSVFVLPLLLYLRFGAREEPLRNLKLSTHVRRGVSWGVIAGAVYAALVLVRALLFKPGGLDPKPVPVEEWFTSLTVATFIEEVAFRGFLLQQFERVTGFWRANVITACLFVAIHFPGWILIGGSTLVPGRVVPMVEILFLGLLLGYLFKRTGSLWACIILHSVNNLAAIVLFM